MAYGQYPRGTSMDTGLLKQQEFQTQLNKTAAVEAKKTPKQLCQEKGGYWDEATQSCVLLNKPSVQQETPVTPQAAPTKPEYFTDEKGNVTGLTLPNGGSYLGLKEADVNAILSKYGNIPSEVSRLGGQPAGTQQAQVDTQAQNQRLMQLAQQGLLTPEELQSIQGAHPDIGQALGAGAVGVLPGAIGGAAVGIGAGVLGGALTGAAAGSVVPVAGTIAGAIIGALGGFLVATRSNIKSQQAGEFTADQYALTKGERYLRSLVTDTNKNPQNAPENIRLFYKTLNLIDAAHAKTYRDSQENLNKFLGNDGIPQLAKFNVFNDTMRRYYINRFNTALIAPKPNQILITADDLTEEINIE